MKEHVVKEHEAQSALNADEGVTCTSFGGNCPVQAEGTIDGHRWYFRARGAVTLSITASPPTGQWPDDRLHFCAEWHKELPFDDSVNYPGWMEPDVAIALIRAGLARWRDEQRP